MDRDPIAVAVAAELERRDMSIRELGRQTGVSYPTLSRWFAGERAIKLADRAAVLEHLGLEIVIRRRREAVRRRV